MFAALARPRVRRAGFIALVALAVLMVSAVAWVMLTQDDALDPGKAFPALIHIDPTKRPNFIFPESVRTYDLSLNRFVDRFIRICMEGKYADFRLMLSSRAGDPIVARRFESMFNALKQVRILALEELPPLPHIGGPVYLMMAEYDLEDYAVTRGNPTERVRLAIAKENGEWRIGPVPSDTLARLDALRKPARGRPGSPATQPAEPSGSRTTRLAGPDTNREPDAAKTAANRPASLNP